MSGRAFGAMPSVPGRSSLPRSMSGWPRRGMKPRHARHSLRASQWVVLARRKRSQHWRFTSHRTIAPIPRGSCTSSTAAGVWPDAMVTIASTTDFRAAARARLPRFLFDYADGGSYAERTLHRNVADLSDIALRQRVLRDVATIDL